MKPTNIVSIQEVSMRDGLQNEPVIIAPDQRVLLIEALLNAGLNRIQIGAFVNPKLVPQMAGTEMVWQKLKRLSEEAAMSVLILSDSGLEKAIELNVKHAEIYVSASETHSKRNSNVSVADAIRAAHRMIQRARRVDMNVTAGVMCAFGCFFEGNVPQRRVKEIVGQFLECGATDIALADTTGMAFPDDVTSMINLLRHDVDIDCVSLHLHDTRGVVIKNLEAALDEGVRRFDASVGGLGGCPFIPGATGNINTLAAAKFLQDKGFSTGIDLKKLVNVEKELKSLLSVKSDLRSGS